MTSLKMEWLGHTTLQFQTENNKLVFQPFFQPKICWQKRQKLFVCDFHNLQTANAVFFGNPKFDRFDRDALRFFKQSLTKVYLDKSFKKNVATFYHFPIVELKPEQLIAFSDITVTPIALTNTSFRFLKFHTKSYCFLIEANGKKILIVNDGEFSKETIERLKALGAIDLAFFPLTTHAKVFGKNNLMPFEKIAELVETLNIAKVTGYAHGFYGSNSDDIEKPWLDFQEKAKEKNLENKLLTLKPFESFEI